MKRILLLICAIVSINTFSQEQLNIGINGGITIGNIEPYSKVAFGADVNYLFDVAEDFVVGPSIGIIYFNPEDEIDAPVFLPVSASILFHSIDDKFYIGGELGYALSLSDLDGGFFIKPTVGYYISDSFKINAFYAGVKTGSPTYGYMGLGLAYDIFGRKGARYTY